MTIAASLEKCPGSNPISRFLFEPAPSAEGQHAAALVPIGQVFGQIVVFQALGLAWLCSYIGAVAALGPLAGAFPLLLLDLIYLRRPYLGFVIYLQTLLYQNIVISIFSPEISAQIFPFLQGTNFLVASTFTVISASRLFFRPIADDDLRVVFKWTCVALGVAFVYTLYGAAASSPVSAVVYFRNTAAGLVSVILGLDLGVRFGLRQIALVLVFSMLPALGISFYEWLAPISYYDTINAARYFTLKPEANSIMYDARQVFYQNTVRFYNLDNLSKLPFVADLRNLTLFRIVGSNMHSISYAYLLTVTIISAFIVRKTFIVLVVIPLVLMIGVKGATILLVMSFVIYACWRFFGRNAAMFGALAFAVVYLSFTIIQGISIGNYHIIGLLGGVNGAIERPIGYGIGAGGNLSSLYDEGVDWDKFQKEGANFGLESAIGVLLYQVGIFSVVILFPYFRLIFALVRRSKEALSTAILPSSLFIVLLNGVFQEEAFSPLALGLIALLCGVLCGDRASRHGQPTSPEAPPRLETGPLIKMTHIQSAVETPWFLA